MIEIKNSKSWKNQIMRDTDPKNNPTKYGIMFQDVYPKLKYINNIKGKINGIDKKYIKYALLYNSVIKNKNLVILFDEIDEFQDVAKIHNQMLLNDSLPNIINLWKGGYDIHIIIDLNDDTIPYIANMQRSNKAGYRPNYDGVIFDDNETESYGKISLDVEKFIDKNNIKSLNNFNLTKSFDDLLEGKLVYKLKNPFNHMLYIHVLPIGLPLMNSFLCFNTYNEIIEMIKVLKNVSPSYTHVKKHEKFKDAYLNQCTWLIMDNAETYPQMFFDKLTRWYDKVTIEQKKIQNQRIVKQTNFPAMMFVFNIKNQADLIKNINKCKKASIPCVLKEENIEWNKKMITEMMA